MSADEEAGELVRVLTGDPSPEELGAVIAVLVAGRAAATTTPPTAARSEWGVPARRLRGTHRHGPGAWRASAWPT